MAKIPYHHDDLKNEMLKKGLQLLNEKGYAAFSLRKLAAICHVSHTAPYRHFKNKDELIWAICQGISNEMINTFTNVAVRFKDDPQVRLLELSKAYVRLMVENPDFFRYVFMTKHERQIIFTRDNIIFKDEKHPFSIVKKFAEDYFKTLCGDCWSNNFLKLWSLVQGFALLFVNQTIHYRGDYLLLVDEMLSDFFDQVDAKYRKEK